jgi:hypothetical protein
MWGEEGSGMVPQPNMVAGFRDKLPRSWSYYPFYLHDKPNQSPTNLRSKPFTTYTLTASFVSILVKMSIPSRLQIPYRPQSSRILAARDSRQR